MKKVFVILVLVNLLIGAPVSRADEGMWTFDNPPLKQWKERYNFEPSKVGSPGTELEFAL